MAEANENKRDYATPHDIISAYTEGGLEKVRTLRVTRRRAFEAANIMKVLNDDGSRDSDIKALSDFANTLPERGGRGEKAAPGVRRLVKATTLGSANVSSVAQYFGYKKEEQPRLAVDFKEVDGHKCIVLVDPNDGRE